MLMLNFVYVRKNLERIKGTQKTNSTYQYIPTRILLENFSISGWRTRNLWSNQNDNHTKNETSLENLKPAWFLNQFRQPFGMVQWAKRWRNFVTKFIMCYWFFFRNFRLRKTYFCDAGYYNNKQTSVQNDGFSQNWTFFLDFKAM